MPQNTCALAGICGGCAYCECSYEEELQGKNERVKGLLDMAAREPFRYDGILASPMTEAYRNKMEYSFGDDRRDGPLTLGLHRRKSFYDVVNTDSCLLVHEDYNQIVRCVRAYFDELGLTYMDKRSHKGYLRFLVVRRTVHTEELLIDLVTSSQPLIPVMAHRLINDPVLYEPEALRGGRVEAASNINVYDEAPVLAELARRLCALSENGMLTGRIRGILHTVSDTLADAIREDRTDVLYGEDYITEEVLGLQFRISPFSFFQTNTRACELLYETVRGFLSESLDPGSCVYDLYSGTGTIAQILAPCVREVVGVEIVPEAVEAARSNAAANGLTNCRFLAGDVLEILDGIAEKPDLIVLDPPRDGINPKALRKILAYDVPTILYVSCKPESLARDLVPMQQAGYRLVRAVAVDQFPRTKNVETLVLMKGLT